MTNTYDTESRRELREKIVELERKARAAEWEAKRIDGLRKLAYGKRDSCREQLIESRATIAKLNATIERLGVRLLNEQCRAGNEQHMKTVTEKEADALRKEVKRLNSEVAAKVRGPFN